MAIYFEKSLFWVKTFDPFRTNEVLCTWLEIYGSPPFYRIWRKQYFWSCEASDFVGSLRTELCTHPASVSNIWTNMYLGKYIWQIYGQIYTWQIRREVRKHNNWRMLSVTANIWADSSTSPPPLTLKWSKPCCWESVLNAPNYFQTFSGHQTCCFCKLGTYGLAERRLRKRVHTKALTLVRNGRSQP